MNGRKNKTIRVVLVQTMTAATLLALLLPTAVRYVLLSFFALTMIEELARHGRFPVILAIVLTAMCLVAVHNILQLKAATTTTTT